MRFVEDKMLVASQLPKRTVALVLAGGRGTRLHQLTDNRAKPAVYFGGKFRIIDFALSNCINSGIRRVGVITQYRPHSLIRHLQRGWSFLRGEQNEFVDLMPAGQQMEEGLWYRGTADAMWQNIDFLKERHEPYVIIASGDCVYKLDYNKVLDYHISKQSDITVVCVKHPEDDINRFGVVQMDVNGQITGFEEKPMVAKSNIASTGVYVIRRRVLIELLERCNEEGRYNFVTDVLIRYMGLKRIYGYVMEGYWSNIASVESYYQTNMDFLKKDVQDYFFRQEPQIYSKAYDLPPAKYNAGSDVKNSLIASGCIINSKVEHSVLFKKVFVGNNSVIKNSIILNGAYIGDNVHVENCIVESNETLLSGSTYIGKDKIRVVAENNNRYEAAQGAAGEV